MCARVRACACVRVCVCVCAWACAPLCVFVSIGGRGGKRSAPAVLGSTAPTNQLNTDFQVVVRQRVFQFGSVAVRQCAVDAPCYSAYTL